MIRRTWVGLAAALLCIGMAAGAVPVQAAAFVVDSTADSGDINPGDGLCDDGTGACTLRAAIWEANFGGPDTINFNIGGGGAQAINILNPLPYIYSELVIDGTTQPGFAGTPLIEIDAANMDTYTGQPPMAASNSPSLTVKYLKISNAADVGFSMQRVDNALIDGLDVSLPSGNQGYGVRAFNSIDNLTVQNITANNRLYGIALEAVSSETNSDVQILNNDLSDNAYALYLHGINEDTLPGGIIASGNTLSGSSIAALYMKNMNDLVISDGSAAGTNIFIAPGDGLDSGPGGSIILDSADRVLIENLDLSLASGAASGQGLIFSNVNDLTIQNSTISNREWAIYGTGGSDFRALNNTLSSNSTAIELRAITAGSLPGGVHIGGNVFSGSTNGLLFNQMSNLLISDGSLSGTNVSLPAGAGLDSVSGKVLELINVDNSVVENLDLSIDPATPNLGTGLFARNSIDDLQVKKVKAANRDTGIAITGGTNIAVLCSDFFDNITGLYTDSAGAAVQENNFQGNATALYFDGNAEYNYWGAADGPSNLGGSGDGYWGIVDADPFLTELSTCQGIPTGPPDSDNDGVPDDQDAFPNDPTRAVLCPAGQFGAFTCVDAPPGSYVPVPGQLEATPCAIGTYQPNPGQSACLIANPGNYVAAAGAAAESDCAPGTYQPDAGQAACLAASPGHFVSEFEAAAESSCAVGTYQADSGQTSCLPSAAGHYVDVTGATAQTACSPGYYQPDAGQDGCLAAPIGSYVDASGAVAATTCPAGTTTTAEASTSAADCLPDAPGNTVAELIEALRGEISELVDQGELSRLRGIFLTATLDRAERRYNLGYERLARRDMRTFVWLVNLYDALDRLPNEAADSLRTQAEAIITAMDAS